MTAIANFGDNVHVVCSALEALKRLCQQGNNFFAFTTDPIGINRKRIVQSEALISSFLKLLRTFLHQKDILLSVLDIINTLSSAGIP